MTPIEVAGAFVAAIHARDADRLAELMTPDHAFVDADGAEHVGRERLCSAWRSYFELVPDYRISVSERFAEGSTVVFLGHASGTFAEDAELRAENHWAVPAAWRVVVAGDRVAVWQLYANQRPMYEILQRIRSAGRSSAVHGVVAGGNEGTSGCRKSLRETGPVRATEEESRVPGPGTVEEAGMMGAANLSARGDRRVPADPQRRGSGGRNVE